MIASNVADIREVVTKAYTEAIPKLSKKELGIAYLNTLKFENDFKQQESVYVYWYYSHQFWTNHGWEFKRLQIKEDLDDR
jgi:hypothetical protein